MFVLGVKDFMCKKNNLAKSLQVHLFTVNCTIVAGKNLATKKERMFALSILDFALQTLYS